MMGISGYGLAVAGEDGWESRIFRRAPTISGEVTYPVVHSCTRALPPVRGDFGGGVVELLGQEDIFVSLVEFGPDVAGRGLFAARGMPPLRPSQFGTDRLPRVLPGRSAAQHFFTSGDRAFCLYVVLGSHSRRMALVPRAARMVARYSIGGARGARATGGAR
jgi:hypothetical protein